VKQFPDRLEITDHRVSLYIAGEKRARAAIEEIDRIYITWLIHQIPGIINGFPHRLRLAPPIEE